MKALLKICVLASLLIAISCNNEDEEIILDSSSVIENFEGDFEAKDFEELEAIEISEKHRNYRKHFAFSEAEVINPILMETVGKSKLIRSREGIYTRYQSNYLVAGHAYTLWLVIWNKPKKCGIPKECNDSDFATPKKVGVEVLFAGSGSVIGSDGKGTFYGRLKAGDDSESINDLFGLPPAGGLNKGKTFSSEVHLVLRSHGPAIPGMIDEQIGGYLGGCSDPFAIAPFTEIPDEEGECGDIEFSLHAPVK